MMISKPETEIAILVSSKSKHLKKSLTVLVGFASFNKAERNNAHPTMNGNRSTVYTLIESGAGKTYNTLFLVLQGEGDWCKLEKD